MSAKDQLIKDLKALKATVEEVDYKTRGYHVEVVLQNDAVRDFAKVMREKELYLVFVGGVHTAEGLEVRYQFASFTEPCRILGRAPVDANCAVDTICDIFQGANWHERETKDMYGIIFTGHPYLQPLLLPEEDADLKPLLKSDKAVKSIEKLRPIDPEVLKAQEAAKAAAAAAAKAAAIEKAAAAAAATAAKPADAPVAEKVDPVMNLKPSVEAETKQIVEQV